MTIKQKISLSFLISLVVATIVFLSLNAYAQKISRIELQRQTLNQIMREVVALNVTAEESLISSSSAQIEEWNNQHKSLSDHIASLKLPAEMDQSIIEQMQLDLEDLKVTFQSLLMSRKSPTSEENDLSMEENVTFDQVLLRNELVIAAALEIDRYYSQQIVVATTSRGYVSIFGMILLTFVIIGNFLLIMRSISRRLTNIIETTKELSKGNLQSTIEDPNSHDEIGQLVQAFNAMAKELSTMYQSLEHKVQERTAKLATEKANVEAIIKSMGDGLVVTDKNKTILMMNPVVMQVFSLTNDSIGKTWPDVLGNGILIEEDQVQATKQTQTSNKKSPASYHIEKKILKFQPPGNTGSYFSQIASPVTVGGEQLGFVFIYRDISKEKEIDKAKTEFVSLASHQLHTPLSTIRWYTELMQNNQKNLTAKQKQYLKEINTSNLRLIQLVNALLNVSRIELGTFIIEPEETDLTKLTINVLQDYKYKIQEKHITITKVFDDHLKVNIDPALTRMILQNLISNAIKYSSDKGKVQIILKMVKKGRMIDKDKFDTDGILISVIDSGCGIPKSQQVQVFTKLFRADNVRKMGAQGTGLGLYIVKSIVEHSGGKIWFTSVENEGTTFNVLLPTTGMNKKLGTKSLEDIINL